MSAALMLVGDRLGLYKELAKGPVTSSILAQQTGTNERYVREWLGNQGAGGYVQFNPEKNEWSLSPEQALCLADPNGPVDMPGAYNIVEATFQALNRALENFQTGRGMEWGEHHETRSIKRHSRRAWFWGLPKFGLAFFDPHIVR
jgi:hypothetical protein